MRLACLLIPLLLASSLRAAEEISPIKLSALTTEHETNPIGIGTTQPRLSWKLLSDRPGEIQTAYEIRATADPRGQAQWGNSIWHTDKITSDQSVLIPWAGARLISRDHIQWQVRVWDKDDKPSEWSLPATFELGLLTPADFKGQWITADLPRFDMDAAPLAKANWISPGAAANQAIGTRYTLNLPDNAKILSATIDANADGLIALYVNGNPTRQGASSHTAPFHADFPTQLTPGKNTIALFSLAVRRPTPQDRRNALAAHGSVDLADGRHIEFNTDATWKTAINPPANWFGPTFDDSAWKADAVLGPYAESKPAPSADSTLGPGRYLRKTFTVTKPIAKARLYSTALGTYEAFINGKPINDHELDPGWTDYTKRVMVQTTDVTAQLVEGPNNLGALLTDGWFAGRIGWMGLAQYAQISRRPLFAAQLEIAYQDGTTDTILSDNTWKAAPGEVVGSDQQLGEVIDHRNGIWNYAAGTGTQTMWNSPDSAWSPAVVDASIHVPLVPQLGPPVRNLMELPPKKITRIGNTYLVDFGQNLVGHIRLKVPATAPGQTITVSHAETLSPDGRIYNENLRQAISLDTFILQGITEGMQLRGTAPIETFEPRFTFHGFRYVQITGFPSAVANLTADNIRAIVVGSDTPQTGTFECSDPDINRLYQNIVWGQRSNFLSVPTDCPQRDERMGWMGDAQVFAPTAARNADVAAFFTKWMTDVTDGQHADGQFNNVNPVANQTQSYPVWADAGVVIPWEMYLAYGDKKFLEDNYAAMARWVDYGQRTFPNLLRNGGVGDHLAPAAGRGAAGAPTGARGRGPGGPGAANPTNVVDTAYFAHSAQILSKAATLLGKPDDAKKYDQLFHAIADAFNKAYINPDGSMQAGTQTTYVLALQFDLLPENLRAPAAKHLTDDIDERAHLTTGFVGVGQINPALTAVGRSDLAYQLLFTDTYPSWLFTVKQGATTMWERWDGYTPDRGFQDSSMNSFNHYSFGSVGLWFYTGIAGIQLDESHPGYKHFLLTPQFTPKLTNAKATLDTPYGLISSAWHKEGDQMLYDATVPPNTSAILTLPTIIAALKSSAPAGTSVSTGASSLYTLPPGTYHFSFEPPK